MRLPGFLSSALCLLLVALVTACGRADAPPARTDAPPEAADAPPVRRMVEVGGGSMQVEAAGLRERKPGQAVVVLESGAGTPLENWGDLLGAVARFAPVVAYDRRGLGRSDWDGVPPTPEHSVAVLRELLDTLDVPPPYVLVGHSWGGALVRYFAGRHPGDVVGLVYIDPLDLAQTDDDHARILEQIGAPASALAAFEALMDPARMDEVPTPVRAESEAIRALLNGDVAGRGIPAPPPIPTAMLLADATWSKPPPGLAQAVDMQAFAAAWQAMRIARMRRWLPASPPSVFTVVDDAGHFVHRDAPEVVIGAIRRVVLQPGNP
ncbi:MAG TPA: alpha/beta hydrolase [Longimicrobium sp.]|nr:alpha/beta hydrolase [Longimicrobium sp.]